VWQGVAAFGLIVAGVALWSVPAALLVAGVLLLADRIIT
jgi:cytochrome c-type biogenesis protein CcmH/NrfF